VTFVKRRPWTISSGVRTAPDVLLNFLGKGDRNGFALE